MSDQFTAPPIAPAGGSPGPGSDYSGLHSIARSPLDRVMESTETTRRGDNEPQPHPDDVETRLQQAREQDARAAGKPAPARPVASQATQASQDSNASGEKPVIEFRSQRQVKKEQQARRAENWNALHASKEEALARVATLEAEIIAARGGTGSAAPLEIEKLPFEQLLKHPEVKKYKEERDTFYEEVKHTRVEADPEFKAKFDSKRDAAIRAAKQVSGAAGEEIAKILGLVDPDVRRHALAERVTSGNFSEATRNKIMMAAGAIDAIEFEKSLEIESRKATWEQTQAGRAQQQAAQYASRVAKLDSEFNDVVTRWADPEKGMPFVLNNKDEVIRNARQIFGGETSAAALADAAMRAAVLPEVIKMAQAGYAEVNRLNEQLARYTGVYPSDAGEASVPPPARNGSATPADIFNAAYINDFDARLKAAQSMDTRR